MLTSYTSHGCKAWESCGDHWIATLLAAPNGSCPLLRNKAEKDGGAGDGSCSAAPTKQRLAVARSGGGGCIYTEALHQNALHPININAPAQHDRRPASKGATMWRLQSSKVTGVKNRKREGKCWEHTPLSAVARGAPREAPAVWLSHPSSNVPQNERGEGWLPVLYTSPAYTQQAVHSAVSPAQAAGRARRRSEPRRT